MINYTVLENFYSECYPTTVPLTSGLIFWACFSTTALRMSSWWANLFITAERSLTCCLSSNISQKQRLCTWSRSNKCKNVKNQRPAACWNMSTWLDIFPPTRRRCYLSGIITAHWQKFMNHGCLLQITLTRKFKFKMDVFNLLLIHPKPVG